MLLDIYNHDFDIYDDYMSFCFHNCIRQSLEYYGIENAFAFMNASLDCRMIEDNGILGIDVQYENTKPWTIVCNEHIHMHLPKCSTREEYGEIWRKNVLYLEQGIHLIVGVDIFHLPYDKYYQSGHGSHVFLLCGYDELTNDAYILDHCSRIQFRGKLAYDDLMNARISQNPHDENIFSGIPILGLWAEVDARSFDRTLTICDLVKVTLSSTIQQYYTKDNRGLSGITGLERIINETLDSLYSKAKEEKLLQLYPLLFSFVANKRMLAHYFSRVAASIGGQEFHLLSLQYRRHCDLWKGILPLLIKARFIDSASLFSSIEDAMAKRLQEEESLFDGILAAQLAL